MKTMLFFWLRASGLQDAATLKQQLLPALGSFLSILAVFLISAKITGFDGAAAIIPSMGAAIVLLMAAPNAVFSRPWALFAGNVLSAAVGVGCYHWLGDTYIGAGSAVGLAILVMLLGRCLHPPGGATALTTVIGGDVIHELGFYYIFTPTLLNCIIIYLFALSFNHLSDKGADVKQTESSETS
ncbi:HPP family protein [Thalassomonas viridans]|uniref:HPP family protein n=1 Tax=Thalassomonas viridans TaxID=137584 RepID=A0AAF0CAH2_9GAMM|nr:HPP family protein [Thalassomonas viridans]WDE08562.1 HPP family protein [Thalassomonas viridans]